MYIKCPECSRPAQGIFTHCKDCQTKSEKHAQVDQSGLVTGYVIDKVAFEGPDEPDRGYTVKATYLKKPKGDALVEIFKDGELVRNFLFPSYKVWNIAAHFGDIVSGEIEKSNSGYKKAAWDGISGATVLT